MSAHQSSPDGNTRQHNAVISVRTHDYHAGVLLSHANDSSTFDCTTNKVAGCFLNWNYKKPEVYKQNSIQDPSTKVDLRKHVGERNMQID